MQVSISRGNSKMGELASVSLPSIVTCRHDCECCKKCYAHRYERRRPNVHEAYLRNLQLLNDDPDTYWREVEAAIMLNRFFRFHVSGDIPNMDYLIRMTDIAACNPHCQILCFTKKYELVNEFIDNKGVIPENLHLVFSKWKGLEMPNPHNLPEAHVLYRDGSTTARNDAIPCGGNCTTCALTGVGCWELKNGQQVIFHEH